MEDRRIYKANALIEAGYRLSVAEHRILLACISQVRRDSPITDEVLYTVRAKDIAERADISRQAAYQDLKAAADRLFERHVTVPYAPDGKAPVIRKFRWVQEAVYHESEGKVSIRLSKPVLPYLSQLTERFTVYQMDDVARMTSAHGIRLYELLVQWRGRGEREVEVGWLKRSFQLEGQYASIKDFKRWVIEPAVEQINNVSPLWVEWDQRKTGRKVTHLRFTFGLKDELETSKPSKGNEAKRVHSGTNELVAGIPKHVIEQYANPGESYTMAAARLHADRREGKVAW
ncbi:replication initiator protein [Modicisalibacter xianhensis]|uniref:Replication initiator protein n=1 Tax=Modicisalibacter xianhensis TaxID=442341 RepID=A0A4R8FCG3_9GAMM|nr:replication initiation protein [Halomonas xianhensis]TDX22932.1 replication initiator protein [Halomonas xianhensis]